MPKFVIAREISTILHMHLRTSRWNLEEGRITPGSPPGTQADDCVQSVAITEW